MPASLLIAMLFQAAPAPQASVTVSGTRSGGNNPTIVDTAKSKVLAKDRASSCGFFGRAGAADNKVVQAYMNDFRVDDTLSNDSDRFSDLAPAGDASTASAGSSLENGAEFSVPDPMAPTVGCSQLDRNFAAGRNAIERKDKSLAQAFEAMGNKDYARALELFSTAWKKVGYEEAALMLAKMHLTGMGTPKDTALAVKYLREVSEARYDPSSDAMVFNPKDPQAMNERVEATFMLARLYERGLGVPKDAGQARKWYAKALEFGFVPAAHLLGQMAARAHQQEYALKLFRQSGEAGYLPSLYLIGKLYYAGEWGLARDLKQAGAYFEAAARGGHPGALFAAGRLYDQGEGVAADPKKAIVYYKEAATRGDRDAQYALGTYFYNGEQVPKDPATARKLFDAAARQGQPDAMFTVGAMAANGEGGPRDLLAAYVWLSLSGQQGAGVAKSIAPKLSAEQKAKADAILK